MNYFDDPNSKHFSFESFADGLEAETFGVINFKGYEAISKTYDFEIMLVSSKKDIELEDMLQSQAVFTIHRGEDDDVAYNGILSEFDQLHEVNDVVFYRARLVPKLWWLTLTHHNQVFLNQSVSDFVEDALRDGGLETEDFDIGTLSGYEENDYICQYNESHFNFVSRCMERQGIYYYFTQEDDGEVLVLTDTKFSHDSLKEGAELFYNPASGLEGKHLGEAIGAFTCRQKQLPTEIILKDYNYERPSLDITSHADVDEAGRGISYIYGEYFATTEEGERLANIRAEELLCQKQEFFGESTVPYIMPGFTFNMNNHYREDFNQEYLILEVTHEGNQSHLMSGGIATDAGKSKNQAIYRNTFKAISNEVQYRPERITEKPKISGAIHAKIDSEVDSEYAQIDEQGRYRVRLPFDINDEHMDGKGSAPIRMMQSYAGKNRGMQFPLVKGTEVLLTFIEGNPDRPIIAGAVSNPETQGPVNAENMSESVIQTGGNNRIRMEDKAGFERMVFESPMANSWIRVGASNDPIILSGPAIVKLDVGDAWTDPGAFSIEKVTRRNRSFNKVNDVTAVITKDSDTGADLGKTYTETEVVANEGVYTFTYTSANSGTATDDVAKRFVVVGDIEFELDETGSGIRIRSAGTLALEALSRYGEYHGGTIDPDLAPTNGGTGPSQIGDMLKKFGDYEETPGVAAPYKPTNLLPYGGGTAETTQQALDKGQVEVSSLDSFSTQEGNVYDFGGYWSYNLGNGYVENHIDQSAELNVKHDGASIGSLDAEAIAFAVGGNIAAVIAPLVVPGVGAVTAAVQGGPGGALAGGFIGGATALFSIASTIVGLSLKPIITAIVAPNIHDVIAGPNSGEIKSWAGKVTMDTSTAWVEKKIGDAYDYTEGNKLDITNGNTESHTKGDTYEYKYGGKHEEATFSKGLLSHWQSSGGGHKVEASWDKTTGQFESFNYGYKNFFSFSVTMPTIPKLAVTVAMSTLDAKVDLSLGTAFDFKLAAAVAFEVNLAAGFYTKFERKVGGELEWNEVTGKREFKAFGFKAAKAEAMKAEQEEMMLKTMKTELYKTSIALRNIDTKIEKGGMHILNLVSMYM